MAPIGQTTRPTPVKVRQATYNSLESLNAVIGSRIVDLFAGTGALSIEGLSRGAISAVLCEPDRAARISISTNLAATGFLAHAKVSPLVAHAWLTTAAPESCDLVFADPPYRYGEWPELLALVAPILTPHGLLVAESDRDLEIGDVWEVVRCKRYGTTVVTILGLAEFHDRSTMTAEGDQP